MSKLNDGRKMNERVVATFQQRALCDGYETFPTINFPQIKTKNRPIQISIHTSLFSRASVCNSKTSKKNTYNIKYVFLYFCIFIFLYFSHVHVMIIIE